MSRYPSYSSDVYYRLICLWVMSEAMLGGVIHGLRLPVSGLIVGSAAVLCITMIAWHVPVRGAIIKATIIVAIFKMMLSPHSPPPAYIAVFFQGALGEILFNNRKYFRIACLVLGILALVESGLQRILVLTVVYGNDLWTAINDFIRRLTGQEHSPNYSYYIAATYVSIHFIAGAIIGWFAGKLPSRIASWKKQVKNINIANTNEAVLIPSKKKKRKRILIVTWILLALLYIQSQLGPGSPLLPAHISLQILLRSVLIVLTWYLFARPVLTFLLRKWLDKKKSAVSVEIERVYELLPQIQQIVVTAWSMSDHKKGFARILGATKNIIALSLQKRTKYFLITGAINSGKTSRLLQWSSDKRTIAGILTPKINGVRNFYDISKNDYFPMEANPTETAVEVGKYKFSYKGFQKATGVLKGAMKARAKWIVIDEIGPLELRGEGFDTIIKNIVQSDLNKNIVFVIRDGLVEEVLSRYNIEQEEVEELIIPQLLVADPGLKIDD